MRKKFCHLLVGFSVFPYFKNLIESTIRKDKESEIIIVTTGNPKFFGWGGFFDFEYKENLKIRDYVDTIKKTINNKIYYYEISNSKKYSNKVGALYKAYNLGIKKAKELNIDILNIMQNDSQLMLWSENIKKIIVEVFKKEVNTFYISTGFLRKTVHSEFDKNNFSKNIYFSNLNKTKKVFLSKNTAVTDWGLFDIKKLKKINFKFLKNEHYLSNNYYKKGFNAAYSPVPIVAFIPWPIVVRKNKIIGKVLSYRDDLYLKLKFGINEKKILNSKNKLWTEDYITTNNWWALEPYWYSDINLYEYLLSVIKFKKNISPLKLKFSQNNHSKNLFRFNYLKTHRPEITKHLLLLPYLILLRIIKKIFF